MISLEDRLRRCCDLVDILSDDVRRHISESHDQDDAFVRRGFVRCVCAYMEGVTHVMKQAALIQHQSNGSLFTPSEILLLSEVGADLKENGTVVEKKTKLSTLPNLRFAFLSFAKAQGIDLAIDFSGAEWGAVRRAFEVRGKLMHPKSLSDLEISDAEAKNVLMAGEWFHEKFLSLMGQTAARARVSEMKKRLLEFQRPLSNPQMQPTNAGGSGLLSSRRSQRGCGP
jgi:hypothetical protein